MKKTVMLTLAAATALCGMAQADDPVLMTIDGKPVYVSEFNYLYNKNNSQQIEPLTIDDYVQRFVNYKLKVLDAQDQGMDTTATFTAEFQNFRNDLARPYLRDKELEDSLVREAYSHMLEDVYVSHIMMPESADDHATLDSLRRAIIVGETTYEDVARKYSIDRSSAQKGGLMGYVTYGRFPWPFEKASFDTPVGEMSPVISSGMGYHIVRPESRRPARGEVKASHILLLTRGSSEEQKVQAKHRIDSLYNVLTATPEAKEQFAELATRFSEDPGSARQGGQLGWFGSGRMVQEFDSVAFALADGEISHPFSTAYGYHIIWREDSRGVAPLSEVRDNIVMQMASDERGAAPAQRYLGRIKTAHNARLINKEELRQMIADHPGGYDAEMIEILKGSDLPLIAIGDVTYPVSMAMPGVAHTAATDPDNAVILICNAAQAVLDDKARDIAINELYNSDADFRNLLNEYHDGMLMFEISNANVWEKSKDDKAGLDKFFKKNAKKYHWDQPKFKSTIIFATSDSLLTEALEYAATLPAGDPEGFVTEMRKKFGKEVKVERVIAAKGENAITDYLAFGGEKPQSDSRARWIAYDKFNGRIIPQPEEAIDVRGAAMTDYQNALEAEWVKKLRKKHKVKIDKAVLKTLN